MTGGTLGMSKAYNSSSVLQKTAVQFLKEAINARK
jgi:hypothetical protein